jgi:MoaA/NifB/PqqE/SkfB family radical SAM enzyme
MNNNFHIFKTFDAYNNKMETGNFFPVYYGIEVTRHCNFKCIICPHSQLSSKEKGHMDEKTFEKIVLAISPFAKIIKLHWIGEPLLHPKIIDLIKFVRKNTSAKLYLSTNGSMLSGKKSEQIRSSGIDKLIITLNGFYQPNNKILKLKKQILKNAEFFINSVLNKGGPICHLKMFKFKDNDEEINKFIQKWTCNDCVIADIMWISNWAGNVPGIRNISDFRNPISNNTRTPCSDLWFKMQIDWRGSVALCCFDAKCSINIGNIKQNNIEELWHNIIIKKIRKEQINDTYTGICSACLDWAVPSEYEFWYKDEELIKDPQRIWTGEKLI